MSIAPTRLPSSVANAATTPATIARKPPPCQAPPDRVILKCCCGAGAVRSLRVTGAPQFGQDVALFETSLPHSAHEMSATCFPPRSFLTLFLPLVGGGIGIVPPSVAHVNQEIPTPYQALRRFRWRHGPNTGDVLSDTSGAEMAEGLLPSGSAAHANFRSWPISDRRDRSIADAPHCPLSADATPDSSAAGEETYDPATRPQHRATPAFPPRAARSVS